MIVVVEGLSAAGKTTWITAHCRPGMVIAEAPGGPAPDRNLDPDGAAAHWARISALRWHAAHQAEHSTGTAVCDTDPLKLHYVWSLWRTGHASRRQWHAELNATRELFAQERLVMRFVVDSNPASSSRPVLLSSSSTLARRPSSVASIRRLIRSSPG